MAFNELQSQIVNNGVSTPNRFNVIIELPNIMNKELSTSKDNEWLSAVKSVISLATGANKTTRTLGLAVEQTEMPGKNISVTDVKYNGDYYKVPYGLVYGAHPFVFRVGNKMYEKDVIDKWMSLIYDTKSHTIKYYDDFVSTITIQQLDKNDNVVYSVKLFDAFPSICNPLTYSQNDNNTYNKLSVQFFYRKWEKDVIDTSSISGIGSLSQTPLGPIVDPILSNPAVQRGLTILEDKTGLDLEGEAINIYNQVDTIVKDTTGTSVNKNTTVLSKLKTSLNDNEKITPTQQNQLGEMIGKITDVWS